MYRHRSTTSSVALLGAILLLCAPSCWGQASPCVASSDCGSPCLECSPSQTCRTTSLCPPSTNDDTFSVLASSSSSLNVASNDVLWGVPAYFAYALQVPPSLGTATLSAQGLLSFNAPAQDGLVSITYRVCSLTSPDVCDAATVSITVSGGTQAPARGACCSRDGTCVQTSAQECTEVFGGMFSEGAGCGSCTGCCCLPTSFVANSDLFTCSNAGGSFQPLQDCSACDLRGACLSATGCTYVLASECAGTFRGYLTRCGDTDATDSPNAGGVPAPVGACCNTVIAPTACLLLTQETCETRFQGDYGGDQSACGQPDTCGVVPVTTTATPPTPPPSSSTTTQLPHPHAHQYLTHDEHELHELSVCEPASLSCPYGVARNRRECAPRVSLEERCADREWRSQLERLIEVRGVPSEEIRVSFKGMFRGALHKPGPTVYEVLEARSPAFVALVGSNLGLLASLQNAASSVTVFLPSAIDPNAAVSAGAHVLLQRLPSSDFEDGLVLSTASTLLLRLNASDPYTVNDVPIVETDVLASNGVIHVIEGTL